MVRSIAFLLTFVALAFPALADEGRVAALFRVRDRRSYVSAGCAR